MVDRRTKLVDLRRAGQERVGTAAGWCPTRKALGKIVTEPAGQDRTEDRGSECAAEGPKELAGRRRDAHVRHRYVVLRNDHKYLHAEADADSGDGHIDARLPQRRIGTEQRQRQHADGRDERPDARDKTLLTAALVPYRARRA